MTTPVHDEHGNIIPIDPGSQVGQAIQLLEYCRARDYRIGPYVRIEGLVVQIEDLRQSRQFGPSPPPPDDGPWKAVGYDPDGDGG